MRAVRIHAHGGPEIMRLEDLPTPVPGPDQVLVDVHASGVNFIDIRQRTGDFTGPTFPITLGWEGAGEVAETGPGVISFQVGDQVAWHWHLGSYASQVLIPTTELVPVPQNIDTTVAAAVMLQGLTAHTLASSSYSLQPGETCLVHSAAGGVGGLLAQMAKARGARVIGTVSRPEKVAAARQVGADDVIVYTDQALAETVRRITDGRGVDVVYDGIGKDTFLDGLDALRPGGYMVMYGQASGPVPPVDTHLLQANGGRYLTRATFGHYITDRSRLLEASDELFGWVQSGELSVRVSGTYPLEQAALAHREITSRTVSGKLLLIHG